MKKGLVLLKTRLSKRARSGFYNARYSTKDHKGCTKFHKGLTLWPELPLWSLDTVGHRKNVGDVISTVIASDHDVLTL